MSDSYHSSKFTVLIVVPFTKKKKKDDDSSAQPSSGCFRKFVCKLQLFCDSCKC